MPAPVSQPSPSMFSHFWIVESSFYGSSGAGSFGSSVVSGPGLIVVGEPLDDKFTSFQLDHDNNMWSAQQEIFHTDLDTGFGMSTSRMVNNALVAGVPFTLYKGTNISVGSAQFFMYDSLEARWKQFGKILRGDENFELAANETFGSSVALSKDYRVAVGAPRSSFAGSFAGRVYTFELDDETLDWKRLEPIPLVGEEAGDSFGSSVAISGDGLTLFVGSPGSVKGGFVQIFTWADGDWIQKAVLDAKTEDEGFGASLELVDERGDLIIVGAPNYGGNRGRVNMYKRNALTDLYAQIGDDIEGNPGSYLGESNGISAFSSSFGVHLAVLSQTGEVIRVDFSFSESSWKHIYEPIAISPSDGNSINMFTYVGLDWLVVGMPVDEAVSVYWSTSLARYSATSSPTMLKAPTRTPTASAKTTTTPTAATINPTVEVRVTNVPLSTETIATATPVINVETVTAAPQVTITQTTPSPSQILGTRFEWVERGGPYRIEQTGTGYGSSVAISSNVAVVSVPLGVSVGVVLSFRKPNGNWQETPSQQIGGSQDQSRFGAAIDLNDDLLLIGAPHTVTDSTLIKSGSAFCHSWIDGSWIQQGPTLYGSTEGFGADEEFGAAVAVSARKRLAVGAPGSNAENAARIGRVYIFEYEDASSKWTNVHTLIGRQAGDAFGKSIALSQDGKFLVVGSPGNRAGFATIYEYNSLGWFPNTRIIGEFENEETGSSVCFLQNDGSSVAVGSPAYDSGKGRIFVYERNDLTGRYNILGEPLVGESGERFGAANRLAGSVAGGLNVLVGTTYGLVKTFGFNRSANQWEQAIQNVDTGYRSRTGLLSLASYDNMFIVGGDDAASIFELNSL